MNSQDQPEQNIDYWQVLRNHWGVVLLTLLMAVVTSFVVTTLMPEKYTSTTRFQILPDRSLVGRDEEAILNPRLTRDFLATQVVSIREPSTLKLVDGGVKKREYTKGYGDDYNSALIRLAGKIDVELVRGTSIVNVSVTDTKKEVAQQMADKVRNMYEKKRLDERSKNSSTAVKTMGDELELMKAEVKLAKADLDKSTKEHGLIYVKDRWDEVPSKAKSDYENLSKELQAKETALNRFKGEVESLRELSDQDLIYHIESDVALIKKPRVPVLAKSILDIKDALEQAKIDTLLENHPRVKSLNLRLKSESEELATEVESARELIEKLFENKNKELKSVEKDFKAAKENYDKHVVVLNEHKIKIDTYERAVDKLEKLKNEKRAIDSVEQYMDAPIIVEQEATLPYAPSSPNVPLIMGVGSAAGLICGLGIAFLLELMDTSVKTMEDVERYLQVPVLAVVPQDVGLLHEQSNATPDAEAYRILRTNIEFNRKNPEDNVINVVSGGAGEGKSTTVVNLAYICAQGGYNTLVIDGDLRRPRLHTYFDLPNRVGLTNYLTTDTALESVIGKTPIENLFFMPSGNLPNDAAGVLNSRRMTEMLELVKSRFDIVFVDSPPILGVSDASVISSEVDHTIIVVQHRKLPRKLLMRVKQAVESVGGNIIGVVLNNVDVRSDTEYQYYTSYYTYYTPTAQREAAILAESQNEIEAKKSENNKLNDADDLY